ncbi:MAG: sigma-70 family polymerase sigma factor [Chitinophagaceae bacterium]|nr:sigma-70 family polymerase sigma factor [Chitinophagaceae bacterium]
MISKFTYGEAELVTQLQHRNNQAFTYLYDNYSKALYGVISQIVPDRESADDILQEVFINIWRKIETYDISKGRLFTWMLNIARNAAIDKIRSKSYRNELKNQALPDDVSMLGDQFVKSKADETGLKKVLGKLKKEQRELIELSYFQGFTQEEISKGLNIPLGTVKTRMRSALLQLRSMIEQ